jgi:putative ABC transport system permease protein
VAVVGQTIVEELFEGADPIGETIRVRGLPLTVIGVLAPKGMSLMGSVQDDIVLVPYSTAFQRISGRSHAMVINVQVLTQFLIESVVLCLLGGIGGILIGVVSTNLIAAYAGWPALFSTAAMIAAVSVSAAVGLFFGFYPAWKAARLDPTVALRTE